MRIGNHETHPAADIFPLLEGPSFAALVADIVEHGQRDAIVLYRGAILDGRNRYRACLEACAKPTFVDYDGDDPVAFVISHNLHRRHLSESQRGMVAGRIANMTRGGDRRGEDFKGRILPLVSQGAAAEMMNITRPTVQAARVVLTQGIPDVVRAVDSGDLAVSAAKPLACLPEETQREIMQKANGNSRVVRSLVREAGGDAPVFGGAKQKPSEPPSREPEGPLTGRQRASRDIDAKVRELWESGAPNQAEIARAIGVNASTVSGSMRRQGITKKPHPIQTVERRAQETVDDLSSFMSQPEVYRDGADAEYREQCIKSLRALSSAVSRTINWLNKEAS